MKFRIARRASKEIDALWDHIASDSVASADKVESSLHNAMKLLAEFPGVGHLRRDVQNKSYRFFSVFDYLIAYRVRGKTLTVVRVLHGHMDVRRRLNGHSTRLRVRRRRRS